MDAPPNDTHTTDGEKYRSPSHPEMISALGRAMWNFLSLEESVVAILFDAGWCGLQEARSKMAGGKEREMRLLRDDWSAKGVAGTVIDALDAEIKAFREATREYRNALGHAHPFTAGYEEGIYMPGLAYSNSQGAGMASKAAEIHEMAHRIEDAIDPLSEARLAVRGYTQQGSPTSQP